MKFSQILIQESITKEVGIKEINLNNLSNVVALVGKNGSGKSRILDLLEANITTNITLSGLLNGYIKFLPSELEQIKRSLTPFKDFIVFQDKLQKIRLAIAKFPSDINLQLEQERLVREISNPSLKRPPQGLNIYSQELSIALNIVKKTYIRRVKNTEIRDLKQVVDNNNNNNNVGSLPFENLFEKIEKNASYNEFTSINRSALLFLSKLPHKLAADKVDCLLTDGIFEEKKSYKRFLSLKGYIESFLKKEFVWEAKSNEGSLTETGAEVKYTGVWKIDNRLFNYNEFSDGEKTLFAYALLFFLLEQNPTLNIKESVLILDEPELHLHPDSEIELIERIREVIGEKGQLIFATHSINILSHLNYDEIFLVKQNNIEDRHSLTPKNSLNELMNLEERVSKLSEFIDSMESWTYSNFMAQCFSNPEVIESSKKDDPQVIALKEAISKNSNKECNLLLDFGAGKGRIFEQIKSDYPFINNVSYSALEPDNTFHSKLKELGTSQIFVNHTSLPENAFDFIVLCNVLHEIKLEDWIEVLNKTISALKETGFLIIIEAKKLNKGEKIGKTGYLLLDLEEMRALFNLNKNPSSIKSDKSKITCGVFPKSQLHPINNKNLVNCFEALSKNTLEKIMQLREQTVLEKDITAYGRESAFLSQQHINALLALKQLDVN